MVDQLRQLGLNEGGRVQGQRVVARILEVPLHAHGAEQEETDGDRGGELQAIGHRPRGGRSHHGRLGRAPRQLGRLAARVAGGEAHAFVGGVGPQLHDAAGRAFQVDLERVAARVLVDACRIAFIRGGVIEPRLREGEVGGHGVACERDGGQEREEMHARRESYAQRGRCATRGALLTGYGSPPMLAAPEPRGASMGEALTVRALRSALFFALLLLDGCRPEGAHRPLFNLLAPSQTGVTFANTITTNDSVNVQTDVYVYNGAGVAIGDIDNDGLPDIFFTGNMVSSRLYLNKGNMRFEDITQSAGVGTNRWATGATMVDINNDGHLDIYVSVSGSERSKGRDRANLLFINNGDHKFTSAAARYGIADTGFTTHAVFFDYNGDGYLDLFLLNNSPEDFARGAADTHPLGVRSNSPGGWNTLYRNNGDGTFTDVSREAGILRQVGYGLGVVVADLNGDGWPDLYVSNDVAPNDVLYINNGDGTFTDRAGAWLKHASFAGIGVDIADFNNDGWPDILQVDMMPAALDRQKRMSGYLTHGGRMDLRRRGFRDDYDVNSLQLSNGVTKDGDVIFSDIAPLAGVAYTDWSWSPLFADFDNDGYKDILVTNGYPKAANDLDYQTAALGARRAGDHQRALRLLKDLHSYRLSNYGFRNNGDLTFTDKTKAWGMDQPGFSYGAAYADLNNDGRLDIVVNNIDAPASIYENVQPRDDAHHYLQIKLEGESPNRRGIGSTLILTAGGQKQYLYHSPYRGYMSTMDDRDHFGLGNARRVDSLEVTWPDGRYQLLTNLAVDRMVTLKQEDATRAVPGRCRVAGCLPRPLTPDPRPRMFQPMDARRALKYKHTIGTFVDYNVQPLLPYELSRQCPPLAVADVNGDGLDGVFIGGAARGPGQVFLHA